jgi:hypothetical protein
MSTGSISLFQIAALLMLTLLVVVPFWNIFRKAGHPAWLSILLLVPVLNVALIYYLAFAPWPSLTAGLEQRRARDYDSKEQR